VAALLAGAVLFGIAHTQTPLYYSNQNQYFLHGLAAAGKGFLAQDWLANTRDPTPLFSAVVAFTARHLNEAVFYVYYFLLLGIYFISLARLAPVVLGRPPGRLTWFCFLTALVVVHAALVRWGSVRLFGFDWPWYFQCGVANQYVLGFGLQPSAFGVLLIASLAAFANGRLVLAVLCSSAAAVFHATYLLPAALLTLTYMLLLAWDGRWRPALLLGVCALLAVLPVVVYAVRTFGPSSPGAMREAQRILVEERIPNHALVRRWLDPVAVGQLAWFGLALLLVRRTKLFPLLALPALGAALLTLVQVVTGNTMLALLFPWRLSAVLVPVATAVILVRAADGLSGWVEQRPVWQRGCVGAGCAVALVAVTAGGIVVSYEGLGYQTTEVEVAALEYVRDHKQGGDLYLIPVRVPDFRSPTRWMPSTTFAEPPRPKDRNFIPIDLQRFRLFTGAPIYVDFKAIPYRDVEVLEWYRRLRQCQAWYAENDWGRPALHDELTQAGITHVLLPADRAVSGNALELLHADPHYRIYRVRPLH
jgi:hypothetical protein